MNWDKVVKHQLLINHNRTNRFDKAQKLLRDKKYFLNMSRKFDRVISLPWGKQNPLFKNRKKIKIDKALDPLMNRINAPIKNTKMIFWHQKLQASGWVEESFQAVSQLNQFRNLGHNKKFQVMDLNMNISQVLKAAENSLNNLQIRRMTYIYQL